MNSTLSGVLSGIRVVEQGTFITGPCAGMMLADLGADVIKIESPDGDPYRAYQGNNYSPHFQAYNRNKRSIVCDLKSPADRALFERLIAGADVYIQNFSIDDRWIAIRRSSDVWRMCACASFGRSLDFGMAPSAKNAA